MYTEVGSRTARDVPVSVVEKSTRWVYHFLLSMVLRSRGPSAREELRYKYKKMYPLLSIFEVFFFYLYIYILMISYCGAKVQFVWHHLKTSRS